MVKRKVKKVGKINKQTMTKKKKMTFEERVEMIIRVAKEYSNLGPTELAREYGVSKQRIFQIVTTLRKKGVSVPRYKTLRNDAFNTAVRKLLTEQNKRNKK